MMLHLDQQNKQWKGRITGTTYLCKVTEGAESKIEACSCDKLLL
jgi:hypothetical protein